MKIALMSDVHLEFADLPVEPVEADVLLLAGDIFIAKDLTVDNSRQERFVNFIESACSKFKHVIFICGNHEHYHGDVNTSYDIIRETFKHLSNLYVMDNEVKVIDDITFIGGTLWTDMNKECPHTLYTIKGYMNDYRQIEDSAVMVNFSENVYATDVDGTKDFAKVVSKKFHQRAARFTPERSVALHKHMRDVIRVTANGNPSGKLVVVGHHPPSKLSTKPQYEKDTIVNGAYSSDMSELILDNPQIKLWVHGHTHSEFDYMIGSTRIVANPRGYVGYERGDHAGEPYFAKVMEI
jgi:Icc-related predicted phosphoesterase